MLFRSQALITSYEYGAVGKLLFGSDFPNSTAADAIKGLRNVNAIVEGTNFPKFPENCIDLILYENWKEFFKGMEI